MTKLTYRQAQEIAAHLVNKDTKPAVMLTDLVKKTGRLPTFLIMRHGNPANWREIPASRAFYRRAKRANVRKTAGWSGLVGPFSIRHLETGEKLTANTIKELAAKAGMPTVQHERNLGHVIAGRHYSCGGWYLADALDTKVNLKDIYGNEYPEMTVRDACLKHGLKPSTAISLSTGRRAFFQGLTLASTPIKSTLRPRNWRFASLKARVGSRNVRAKSVPDLANKLGVSPKDIYDMAYGYKTRPDIQLTDVQIEKKAVLETV